MRGVLSDREIIAVRDPSRIILQDIEEILRKRGYEWTSMSISIGCGEVAILLKDGKWKSFDVVKTTP